MMIGRQLLVDCQGHLPEGEYLPLNNCSNKLTCVGSRIKGPSRAREMQFDRSGAVIAALIVAEHIR
jgi:hypothetical protein